MAPYINENEEIKMTVNELIAQLQTLDGNMEVQIRMGDEYQEVLNSGGVRVETCLGETYVIIEDCVR